MLPEARLRIALFKVDCEGCEYEVLPALLSNRSVLARIDRLIGEIHEPAPGAREAARRLKEHFCGSGGKPPAVAVSQMQCQLLNESRPWR